MKKILGLLLLGVLFFACAQKGSDDFLVAVKMMNNGQYDEAIEIFNKIVSQEQDIKTKANALHDIGFCYGLKKDYDKEMEYYKKAIEIYPSCQPALYDLGTIYYNNSDFDNSLKYFERIKEINPDHEGALYMIGLIYKSLGNEEKSLSNLKKAAEFGSKEAKDLLNNIEHEMQG